MESMLAAAAAAAEREAVPIISTRSTVTSVEIIMRQFQVSATQAPDHMTFALDLSAGYYICMSVPGFCVCLKPAPDHSLSCWRCMNVSMARWSEAARFLQPDFGFATANGLPLRALPYVEEDMALPLIAHTPDPKTRKN